MNETLQNNVLYRHLHHGLSREWKWREVEYDKWDFLALDRHGQFRSTGYRVVRYGDKHMWVVWHNDRRIDQFTSVIDAKANVRVRWELLTTC